MLHCSLVCILLYIQVSHTVACSSFCTSIIFLLDALFRVVLPTNVVIILDLHGSIAVLKLLKTAFLAFVFIKMMSLNIPI